MKREEGAGHRHARLEQILLDELRAILRDDVDDPSLGPVRILSLRLSVDYRHARVHFAVLAGAGSGAGAQRALERATPYLRSRIAEAVELKRTPDLRFVFDGEVAETEGEGEP